jgi:uncharacterized protein (DUF885 family)
MADGNLFPFQPVTNGQLRDLIIRLSEQFSEVNHQIRTLRTEMKGYFMALQDDIDAVSTELSSVADEFDAGIAALEDQIAAGQTPDLTTLKATADRLKTAADALPTSSTPVDPTPVDPGV